MDIVNWDALKKELLIRNTVESPNDLVLVSANTTYKKRGDLFQTYAVPASALMSGGGGSITLQTNGIANSDQTLLNLLEGNGIALIDTGGGTIQVAFDPATAPVQKQYIVATADESITLTDTWTSFSSPQLSVESGYIYNFRAVCIFDMTTTNTGTRWAINGTDSGATMTYYSWGSGITKNSNYLNGNNTTFNGPTTWASQSPVELIGNMAIIEGVLIPSTSDTITISVVNDTTATPYPFLFRKGSYIEYLKTPI